MSYDSDDVNSDTEYDAAINRTTEQFKERVMQYKKYEDMISEHQEKINLIKKNKRDIEQYILNFLEKEEQDAVNLGDREYVRQVSQHKEAINMDKHIKTNVIEMLGQIYGRDKAEEKYEQFKEEADKRRKVTEKITLKTKYKNKDKGKAANK